jgi:hypothetical protein
MPPANRQRHFAFHPRRDGATTGAHAINFCVLVGASGYFPRTLQSIYAKLAPHPPAAL